MVKCHRSPSILNCDLDWRALSFDKWTGTGLQFRAVKHRLGSKEHGSPTAWRCCHWYNYSGSYTGLRYEWNNYYWFRKFAAIVGQMTACMRRFHLCFCGNELVNFRSVLVWKRTTENVVHRQYPYPIFAKYKWVGKKTLSSLKPTCHIATLKTIISYLSRLT